MRKNYFMMLALAVATSVSAQVKDVTNLIKNADFSQQTEGWEVKTDKKLSIAGKETGLITVESRGVFSLSQTLTGLENGIYLLQVSGLFDQHPAIGDYNYATTISLNDNRAPLMVTNESMLNKKDAQDQKNCFITPDEVGTDCVVDNTYYLPWSQTGASYAFQGGRYVNRIAAEVTDGSLAVGIQSPGCDAHDWTVFGNIQLTYLGQEGDATEAIKTVVEGLLSRASTTIRKNAPEVNDYCHNFPLELRAELKEVMDEVKASPAWDMKTVSLLSDMLQKVSEGQQAYQNRMNELGYEYIHIIELLGTNAISWDLYEEFQQAYERFCERYLEGTLDLVNNTEVNQVKATRAFQIATGVQDISTPTTLTPIYDLQGRKLQQKPSKGMYIQGGKKVLVK